MVEVHEVHGSLVNYSWQFLFCADDIGKLKSETAAGASQRMNPNFRVAANADKVCPDTQAKVPEAHRLMLNHRHWHS